MPIPTPIPIPAPLVRVVLFDDDDDEAGDVVLPVADIVEFMQPSWFRKLGAVA